MRATSRVRGGQLTRERIAQLETAIREFNNTKEVAVGFPINAQGLAQPNAVYDNKASIIEVAIWNNYGLGVPRRPFMDLARDKIKEKYFQIMQELGYKILDGTSTVENALRVAGQVAVVEVQRAIMTGPWQPNAPQTVAQKRSNRPLIDTRTMHNRVTFVVRDKR